MKIVILGTSWPYRGGGIATYNERLARQFMAEGHEVEILTFTLQYPDFLFPGKTQYSDEPAPADLKIYPRDELRQPFLVVEDGAPAPPYPPRPDGGEVLDSAHGTLLGHYLAARTQAGHTRGVDS